MSASTSITRTATATLSEQVLRVTRPLITDLLDIVEMYGHLTEEKVVKYVRDFRDFMNERYLKEVEITWTSRSTGTVIGGLKYEVKNGEAVRTMDRPGGLQFDAAFKEAQFNLRIHYTDTWLNLSDEKQAQFKAGLEISWSTAEKLNYGNGSYTKPDREYGQAAVGISRLRFQS